MIKRKYDKFNSRCYISVKCDFCGLQSTTIDGYGVTSKEFFSTFEDIGWKRLDNGEIICASCCDLEAESKSIKNL